MIISSSNNAASLEPYIARAERLCPCARLRATFLLLVTPATTRNVLLNLAIYFVDSIISTVLSLTFSEQAFKLSSSQNEDQFRAIDRRLVA